MSTKSTSDYDVYTTFIRRCYNVAIGVAGWRLYDAISSNDVNLLFKWSREDVVTTPNVGSRRNGRERLRKRRKLQREQKRRYTDANDADVAGTCLHRLDPRCVRIVKHAVRYYDQDVGNIRPLSNVEHLFTCHSATTMRRKLQRIRVIKHGLSAKIFNYKSTETQT